ncbi:MAG TPA: NAD(P)-dependent oxidoreductase [Pseudonocardiaceae bacterium]|nr:NAD(P)-dependent oxidoreductase [Pseudonocardiaceae bacterium]
MGFTVLVPEEHGERLLPDLLSGHRIVRYDADDELSPQAEVFVPPLAPSPELIERALRLPRLRMVQLLTVGADPWSGRMPAGVTLSTCRGAHSVAAAEWVQMVLLATFRGLPAFLAQARERAWRPRATVGLSGRRVLVVGAGDVGRTLATRLVASGCTVTLVGRRGGNGAHPVSELPDLLGEHDAVVLVVPLTGQTRGMVDARFLAAMPDGAVLVNAARGAVVDTAALLAELRSGRLSAALDVTDPEPLPPEHPLWSAPNLIVTPHVGGAVHGLYERAYRVAARQIAAFAAGEQPPNAVSNGY